MSTRCRVLIGGFGAPGHRDLDFGRHLVAYLQPFSWPEGVVVEDLSYAAHLVLHRMQELRPPKLVLVGAVASGADSPGSVRRRVVRAAAADAADAADAHDRLAASMGGAVGLDHTLAVLGQWGGLPADTVVLEVEPADCAFGAGFSEALSSSFDGVLEAVRAELGETGPPSLDLDPVIETPAPAAPAAPPGGSGTGPGGPAPLESLRDFAARRRDARDQDRFRGAPLPSVPGLEVAARSRPWGMGLRGGADWHDVVALDGGWVVAVVGSVPGRGMEAVAVKADVAAAARASALLAGPSPARIVENLDRFVAAGGLGRGATVACVALHPAARELRLCSAGECPPLVAGRGFLHDDFTEPLGGGGQGQGRLERAVEVPPGSTVVLFTDGLVESPARPLALGLLELEEAARRPVAGPDELCDHLLAACVNRHRREDDVTLLALRTSPYRGGHDRERDPHPPC